MNTTQKSKNKLAKDLQVAQRKLEIEKALDGIRQRALAMKTTEEIGPVVSETRDALIALGIKAFRTAIWIFDESNDTSRSWSSKQVQRFSYNGEAPLSTMRSAALAQLAPKPKRKDWVITKMNKRQITSEYRRMSKVAQQAGEKLPADWLERMVNQSPLPYYHHGFYFTGGIIGIGMDCELNRSEITIARQITKTFDFAYKRLLDLQAKEERVREAEIEAALERVRAQALGMQESTEIREVGRLMSTEFQNLGYDVQTTAIGIIKPDDSVEAWWATESVPEGTPPQIKTLSDLHPESVELWQGSDLWRATKFDLQDPVTLRLLIDQGKRDGKTATQTKNRLKRLPRIRYYNQVKHKSGMCNFVCESPFSEADFQVAKRFVDVFSFAHDRFLELQEKEDRNRELTIQNALERVRSQALGMQTSEDLELVSRTLFEALRILDLPISGSAIAIIDEAAQAVQFSTTIGFAGDLKWFEVSLETLRKNVILSARLSAKARGAISHSVRLEGEECKAYKKFWAENLAQSNPNAKGLGQVDVQSSADTAVYFSRGWIYIALNHQIGNIGDPDFRLVAADLPTDEEIAMVKRFADVFEFAHDRYLELKQKENQNRELTIQNALERVRSRALGMQESDELTGVATVLRDELENLGHKINGVSLAIIDETSGTVERWFANSMTPKGTGFGPSAVHPLDRRRSHYKNWRTGKQSWISKRDRDNVAILIRNYNKAIGMPETDIAARLENLPLTPYVNFVNFGPGWIGFVTAQPFTDDEMIVACRFVEVFRGAYARFKELKEKENQNRELTIQNGLERVRSRALGMQESNELSEVTRVLRTELINLGLPLRTMSLSFPTDDGGREMWFPPTPTRPVRVFQFGPEVVEEYPSYQGMIRVRERGESDYYFELTQEEMRKFNASWIKLNASYGMDVSGVIQDRGISHMFFFSGGTLSLHLDHELMQDREADKLTEEEQNIARRFTDVFAFAYARFQELKQKEDQNRELIIQNALERVRSRALGMQESHEISEVAKLNFEEMTNLGYDVWRSDIFFFSIEENYLDFYGCQDPNATDGLTEDAFVHQIDPLTTIRETLDKHRLIQEAWATLERGEPQFSVQMEGDELQSYYSDCLDVMWPDQDKEATLARLPKAITDHRFFFKDPTGTSDGMGCVDFVLKESFDEEGMAVGRRFTDAFEFAYNRFRELKQKEEQNRELKIQNGIERVRARALGMQESCELSEVVLTLSEELNKLESFREAQIEAGVTPSKAYTISGSIRASISIWGEDDHCLDVWMRRPSGGGFRVITIDDRRSPWGDLYLKARQAGERNFSYYVSREEAEKYMPYWHQINVEAGHFPADTPAGPGGPWLSFHSFFDGGSVNVRMASEEPVDFSQENKDVIDRFTAAFEFAYDRFLELRDKEERAQEAELRASVDRVRAEATAMAAADDIANVVKALWEGLTRQAIVFDTLVFRVEDAQAQELQMYIAMLEGSSVVTFPESHLLSRGMQDNVNLYQSTMPLEMAHLDSQEHRGLYAGVHKEVNKDLKALWGFELPDDRIARVQRVVMPFAYGQITIIREDEPFSEADLECAESFAEGVSLGFTRYFDFRQLEEQNRALEEANEQIQETTRLKSQFLATMSHELRTPMNAIIGFTRLVLRRAANLEDRQRENLEKVQLSADHLLTLINDILDLSKVEAGHIDLKPSTFRISPLLQQCCATVGPTLGKRDVELLCEIADNVDEVYTDEDRLRQIMINLLSNALKFTDKGEVAVRANLEGSMIKIAVSDTGIGIPKDKLETIFEEFRQVDGSSTRRHQGTGLGLAITKRLIELMGGNIDVESEEGKGSIFTVRIPISYKQEE